MEKSNLRKVTFTLNGSDVFGFQNLNSGDIITGGKDAKEYSKKRKGLFHCFGNGIQFDDNGQPFSMTFAIIEMSNGQIVRIPPQNVKFVEKFGK